MICPVCGAQNEPGTSFCYQCGSALRPPSGPVPATGQTVMLGRDKPDAEGSVPPPEPMPSFGSTVVPQPLSPSPGRESRVYEVPQARPGPFLDVPEQPLNPVVPRPAPYVVDSAARPATQTSTMAVLALVMGILAWILLPVVAAIGAIVTGHMARREVIAANGRITGSGLALAGLILGYLNLIVAIGACALIAVVFAVA